MQFYANIFKITAGNCCIMQSTSFEIKHTRTDYYNIYWKQLCSSQFEDVGENTVNRDWNVYVKASVFLISSSF